MVRPINKERNDIVVYLRDKKKLSWSKIGKHMKLAKSTVYEIYYNEKRRSGLTK